MKKKCFKALALLLTTVLFFNLVFFNHAQKVHAALPPVVIWVLSAVGGYALNEFVLEPINEKLGWSDSDIKTDAEGNVIISESQIEDIKSAYEDAVLAPSGAYMYKGSAPITYKEALADCSYSSEASFKAGNPGSTYDFFWFSGTYPCQYWAPVDACFWVSPSNASGVEFYDANLNKTDVRAFRYDLWSTPAWQSYTDPSAPSGNVYYGEPHICFASLDDLTNYLGIEDTEKPFMVPGMNTEIDNSVTAYDSSIGDVVEIDFKYDKGDLVFTPEGYLYLNYTDIDQDGIPDDHDDELPAEDVEVDTSGMKETVLYEDTVNGWNSGNVQLSDDWTKYDFISFSYSTAQDGGYGSAATSVAYVSASDFLDSGYFMITSFFKRNMKIQVVSDDYTMLKAVESVAVDEWYNYAPRVYVIKGYNVSSSGSGGGSFLDLTKTNNFLESIDDSVNDILKWIKKIYNQVVIGNVLNGVDMLMESLDELGEDLSAGAAAAAEAFTGIISDLFPLCFIYDIFLIIDMFVAEPVAPIFEIEVDLSPLGLHDPLLFVIDLTPYDDTFKMLRIFEILFFIAGLMHLTYGWIVGKGDAV